MISKRTIKRFIPNRTYTLNEICNTFDTPLPSQKEMPEFEYSIRKTGGIFIQNSKDEFRFLGVMDKGEALTTQSKLTVLGCTRYKIIKWNNNNITIPMTYNAICEALFGIEISKLSLIPDTEANNYLFDNLFRSTVVQFISSQIQSFNTASKNGVKKNNIYYDYLLINQITEKTRIATQEEIRLIDQDSKDNNYWNYYNNLTYAAKNRTEVFGDNNPWRPQNKLWHFHFDIRGDYTDYSDITAVQKILIDGLYKRLMYNIRYHYKKKELLFYMKACADKWRGKMIRSIESSSLSEKHNVYPRVVGGAASDSKYL